MSMESRSYHSGQAMRPRPFLLERPDSSLTVVTTSWGTQAEAEKVASAIAQEAGNMAKDQDDILKNALNLVSQNIYKNENLRQVRVLVEALVFQIRGPSITWAQVGQPNLYLIRGGRLAPLAVQPDHSVLDRSFPPLPRVGLGLEARTQVQSGSFRYQKNDQLLCLAQSWEPAWPIWKSAPSFHELTNELIQRQPELAFWCGLLSL